MQGGFLAQCLDSIISQREQVSCEIILVDNNSTDSTADIIAAYRDQIDHLVVESDSGQTNAINKGLLLATGDYINWLCCDDVLRNGALAAVRDHMTSFPDCHVLCGTAEVYQGTSRIAWTRSSRLSRMPAITLAFSRIIQPATFWRRSIFNHLSPLDEDLHFVMDLDLWLRYLASNGSSHVAFIDSVLCRINLHDSCKSIKYARSFRKEIDLVVDRLIEARTTVNGSFHGFEQSCSSSKVLREEVKSLLEASYLANLLKNPFCLSRREMTQVATNLFSVLRHLAFVRPEVLRMYA